MREPDFFLVGALKSGTSAMADFLGQHPDVFVGMKDSCFFGSDLQFRRTFQRSSDWFRPTRERYLALFDDAGGAARVGDACAYYLCSERAAQEIHDFRPDARIVVQLRHPVELVHSLHNQWLFALNEDIEDFREALAAEPDRAAGRRIPADAFWPGGLQYRQIPRFAQQLERFFDVFGRERVLVLLHDEIRDDLAGSYQRVLEHLGVDPAFEPDFSVVNPSKRVRSRRMQRFFVNPPAPVRWAARYLLADHRVRAVVSSAVRRLNARPERRGQLAPDLRASLVEHFRPEVDALERLLDRDLSAWKR